MTIKDVEKESGMTRANIRYYEAEGLLTPVRGTNRYRDYSEEDLEVLKKIKLLRSLQFSLEEIKALQSGKRELLDALEAKLIMLGQEKSRLEHQQEICQVMRDDGVCYRTLDAQHYLGIMEQEAWTALPQSDSVPTVRIPWRRYFARNMDMLFYFVIWNVFLAFVLGVNIGVRGEDERLWDDIAVLSIMLFGEPALLAVFGTTPGKWILGLRITDNTGKRLTYGEGLARTWKVLWRGMGLGIPIWSLFRLWKSYKGCMEEETLEWEYDSAIALKDEEGWRAGAYILSGIFLGVIFVAALQMSELPKNRGDLTVAEFSENYNNFSRVYGYEAGYCLDQEGKWTSIGNLGQSVIITVGGYERPDYQFSEIDGIMTGMHFVMESRGVDDWIGDYRSEMILAVMAFAGAQKERHIFSRELGDALEMIQNAEGESFEISVYGVDIVCELAYSGYAVVPGFGILTPVEGEDKWYSLSFSMVKKGD